MAADPSSTELICHPDGRIYHLNLLPDELAPTVLLVGDPGRVSQVSAYFDTITVKQENREFRTHTGTYKGAPVTVLSTGIGPDNIDIAVNELDALVNTMPNCEVAPDSLNIIRIGTCGAMQSALSPGGAAVSSYAVGLDNIAQFYAIANTEQEQAACDALAAYWQQSGLTYPFYVKASSVELHQHFKQVGRPGFTLTCPGFYGPQGRGIRLAASHMDFVDVLQNFSYEDLRVQNLEMETSALYALGHALGHRCLTVTLALANRVTGDYLGSYHEPMNQLIHRVLDRVAVLANSDA